MKKYSPVIVVQGGTGSDLAFVKANYKAILKGMKVALQGGFEILKKGGSSVDSIEVAISILEDNPLFNAGKGSAINKRGRVELNASIMNGRSLEAGGAALIWNVRNPIRLARQIMERTNHVLVAGDAAEELARKFTLDFEPDEYFITSEKLKTYFNNMNSSEHRNLLRRFKHSTVGAVALDHKGTLASGTSTGGTSFSLPGRLGDSCMIGAGCYANNSTCAISGTGDGEFLVRYVLAHSMASVVEHKKISVQEACKFIINKKHKRTKAEIGAIALDRQGNIGIGYNSKRMLRGWMKSEKEWEVLI